jgi:peptidoglycan/xylan/chitin deacetylase (PgdA/CDA1 family)
LGLLTPLSAGLAWLLSSAVLSIGVFFPRTQIYARWHARVRSDSVALTFDDGPHPQNTRRVLALLAEHGQRATFFVIGWKVDSYPDVVREMVEQGHAVGVHSYAHPWLYAFLRPSQVLADIRRCQQAVQRAAGITPTLFRPPLGYVSPFTAEGARRAGVTFVGWSLRMLDGLAGRRPEAILEGLERHVRPGDIVLLHDSAEGEGFTPASIDVLPEILRLLSARGLRSEALLRHPSGTPFRGPLSTDDSAPQPRARRPSAAVRP